MSTTYHINMREAVSIGDKALESLEDGPAPEIIMGLCVAAATVAYHTDTHTDKLAEIMANAIALVHKHYVK